jgi:hypothetical protein
MTAQEKAENETFLIFATVLGGALTLAILASKTKISSGPSAPFLETSASLAHTAQLLAEEDMNRISDLELSRARAAAYDPRHRYPMQPAVVYEVQAVPTPQTEKPQILPARLEVSKLNTVASTKPYSAPRSGPSTITMRS